MLDGFGGLHKANVPPQYEDLVLPYFGGNPASNLHWVVSLIAK